MTSGMTDRLEGVKASTATKAPVRVATTANVALAGLRTIDGVRLAAGDRVLVKNQSSPIDNGIWKAGPAAWTRAPDFEHPRDVVGGAIVAVDQGSANAGSHWTVVGKGAIAIGAVPISFTPASGNMTLPASHAAHTARREAASLVKDFGALTDGSHASDKANSIAMNAFGAWARAESDAGRAVHLMVPPGVYHYDSVSAANWLRGIRKLTVSAYGARFINTNPGGQAWTQSADPLLYRNSSNPRVSRALKGATTLAAVTPSELAQFGVGETILIMGLNLQYNGYPPNMHCFDFIKIVTVDSISGVMTFAPSLEYDYLPTFPEYSNGGSSDEHPGGAPRLAKLDRNGFTWDVEHVFMGFDARNLNDAGINYITPTGRKISFRDCTVPGFAESICEDFTAIGCTERVHIEPDKLVKRSARINCDLQVTTGIQSASVDTLLFENCRTKLFTIGGKRLIVRNCDIDQLGYGGNYGFNYDTLIENSRIGSGASSSAGLYPYLNTGTRLNYVDGTNVTYANGVFTILKNTDWGLARGGGIAHWNVIPGQLLQFCRGTSGDVTQAGSHLASDIGTGVVLKVEEAPGGGAIAITTTLRSARVPPWSSGQVYIKRRNPLVLRNCTGDPAISMGTMADKQGKAFGEYFRYLFAGKDIASNSIVLAGRSGRLVRFYAKVYKPMKGMSGAKVTFTDLVAYKASTMATPVNYHIDLDLTVAGEREFSLEGLKGQAGNDAVVHNSSPQTELVSDAWCESGMGGMAYNYAPSAHTLSDLPVYEVVFEFDMGLLGKRMTMA